LVDYGAVSSITLARFHATRFKSNWHCRRDERGTIRLRVLFVCLVIDHRRREVLHFNVTDHPTSAWVAQQIGWPTMRRPDHYQIG
jgi:hypothetical protein